MHAVENFRTSHNFFCLLIGLLHVGFFRCIRQSFFCFAIKANKHVYTWKDIILHLILKITN